MSKLINKILFYSKIVFLLIAFVLTLYILLIRMDTNDLSALSIFPLFIPLLLVLIVFVFSFFLNIGNDNIFFNIVGVTSLSIARSNVLFNTIIGFSALIAYSTCHLENLLNSA